MTDATFHIETPRLYLSYFQPALDAHCDFLVQLYNTPEFIASIGGKPTSITTRDAARKTLSTRFIAEHERNGYGTYLINLKPSPSPPTSNPASSDADEPFQTKLARCTPIGTVSLMRGDSETSYKVPDLGFAVLPAHMRQGYAKEAARALLEHVRRAQGVAVVLGLCDPANEGSVAVFRSLGFEDRGTRKLLAFGGVVGAVWITPGAEQDLSLYGL